MSGIYRRPTVIAGVALALVMAVTGIFAPVLAPHDPLAGSMSARLCPPLTCEQNGRSHILGTDDISRDVLSRIVASFRNHLYIGLVGTFVGLFAAWLLVIARSIREPSPAQDTPRPLFRIPFWALAILACGIAFLPPLVVVALLVAIILMGSSLVLVIVCAGVPAALPPMALAYDSAQSNDASSNPVGVALRRGIVLAPIGFSLAFLIGLFTESSLSFMSVGVFRPTPSLGTMVADAMAGSTTGWWLVVFPGGVGLMAVAAFAGIVFPVSRALSATVGTTRPDALQARGTTPAGFRIRLAAQLIDLAAVIVVLVLTLIIDLPSVIPYFTVALVIAIYCILVVSPGKRAVGLRVRRLDGSPAGWGRILFRYLLSLSALCIINLLLIALRKDRRALHDLACDTIVVRRRDVELPIIPGTGGES